MEILHKLTTANGARIAYRCRRVTQGARRDPLVLIHGAASNMTRWTEFVEQTSLAASHDIIRLDLRGHGQSLYRGRVGLEVWCNDIAAILRQEGYRRAILIGHCLGANAAVMFAARYPDQTGGVVLVEPMLREALTGALRRLRLLEAPVKGAIAVIRLLNRLGIYRRRLEPLDLYELDKAFRVRLGEPGGVEELMRRYASPRHDLKTIPTANFLQNLLEVVRPLPLEKIGAPFLAVLSTGRTFADPDITRAVLSRFPRGEIRTLEAQHWIPTEQPQAMRAVIESWIASATSPDRA